MDVAPWISFCSYLWQPWLIRLMLGTLCYYIVKIISTAGSILMGGLAACRTGPGQKVVAVKYHYRLWGLGRARASWKCWKEAKQLEKSQLFLERSNILVFLLLFSPFLRPQGLNARWSRLSVWSKDILRTKKWCENWARGSSSGIVLGLCSNTCSHSSQLPVLPPGPL